MALGQSELIETVLLDLETVFTCKHEEPLTEYMGSKILSIQDANMIHHVKFMQSMLVQKLVEKYPPTAGTVPKLPAVQRQILMKRNRKRVVNEAVAKIYWSVTVKCMFMMWWSQPDIYNTVHRLARHMTAPRVAHIQALMMLLKYVISTENKGLLYLGYLPQYCNNKKAIMVVAVDNMHLVRPAFCMCVTFKLPLV